MFPLLDGGNDTNSQFLWVRLHDENIILQVALTCKPL
jgi:hypothetical protein